MTLTIKVMLYKEKPLDSPLVAVFDQKGGSVGRSKENHLVLNDNAKVVSSIHANIEYKNGCYYYVDNSLNGTLLINRDQLVRHKKIRLHDQDKLQIGDYDLLISITEKEDDILNTIDSLPEKFPKKPMPPQEDSSLFFLDQNNEEESIGIEKSDIINLDMVNNDKFFDSSDIFSDSSEKKLFTEYPKSISSIKNEHNVVTHESFTPPEPAKHSKGNTNFPEDLTLDDFFGNEEQNVKSTPNAKDNASPNLSPSNRRILKKLGKLANNQKKPNEKNASTGVCNGKSNARTSLAHHPSAKGGVTDEKKRSARSKRPSSSGRTSIPAFSPSSRPSFRSIAASDRWLQIFFKAAGMEDVGDLQEKEISELMYTLGTILKEAINGLMTILRGRSELKSQLRVVMTTFKATENNPLKFSPTAEMVLKTFLIDRNPGFLDAVEAIREGFEDVKG